MTNDAKIKDFWLIVDESPDMSHHIVGYTHNATGDFRDFETYRGTIRTTVDLGKMQIVTPPQITPEVRGRCVAIIKEAIAEHSAHGSSCADCLEAHTETALKAFDAVLATLNSVGRG